MTRSPAPGCIILANYLDEVNEAQAVLALAIQLRDRTTDGKRRHMVEEIITALRAEYGLPEESRP